MALKRPAKKNLSPEVMERVLQASREQSSTFTKVTSYDKEFPLFSVPVNNKALVYVPNFTKVNANGVVEMVMDKFMMHRCVKGKEYINVRCARNVVIDELELDGTCPFCDAVSETWDLVNAEWISEARMKGFDAADSAAKESHKTEWQEILRRKAVNNAEEMYTFPIVVIECEVDANGISTLKPKKNADNQLIYTKMYYTASKNVWEKWIKALDSITTEDGGTPTSPAGLWAILNYTYSAKSSNQSVAEMKRDSAKALVVGYKTMPESYKAYEQFFDEEMKAFTPTQATESLVDNVLRDKAELSEVCDTIMANTRDKLTQYKLAGVSGGNAISATISSSEAALASFGAVPETTAQALPTAAAPTAPPQAGINTGLGVDVPQAGISTGL